MSTYISQPPPPELKAVASQVCDRHPDQVRLYAGGKACIGFLVGQVQKKVGGINLRLVYDVLVAELDRRTAG